MADSMELDGALTEVYGDFSEGEKIERKPM